MEESGKNIDLLQPQMETFFRGLSSPAYIQNTASGEIMSTNPAFDKNPRPHHGVAKLYAAKKERGSKDFISYQDIKYELQSSIISANLAMVTIMPVSKLVDSHLEGFIEEKKEAQSIIEDLYLEQKNAHGVAQELSQKLANSQMKFRELARIAPIGIIYADEDFNIQWTNQQANELFGNEIRKDLSFIDLIGLVEVDHFHEKIEKLWKGSKTVKFNFKIITEDLIRYVRCSGVAFLNKSKMPEGYVFSLEDMTETELFIKEVTTKNLELNEVNLELDKFLYSVFHNINGPIASLEGLLEILKVSDPEALKELVHHVRLNLRLLNGFVSDIKNVAVNLHTHILFEPVDLREMIDQLIIFNEEVHDVKIINNNEVPYHYDLNCDINRLNMVLRNIIKNSFQYRDQAGRQLELKSSVKTKDAYHIIEITDNGTGINVEAKPKIFEMFYRGTELSKGNGMGLYNANTIVKKLAGKIEVQSEENEFCTVRIFLPAKLKEPKNNFVELDLREGL